MLLANYGYFQIILNLKVVGKLPKLTIFTYTAVGKYDAGGGAETSLLRTIDFALKINL